MPLPATASRRKGSDTLSSDKNKHLVRHDETKNEGSGRNETHQASNNVKKAELPVSTSVHRKSDADKTLHTDTMEKLALKGIDSTTLFALLVEISDRNTRDCIVRIAKVILFFSRLAPSDSYLYESTEFAGVTVTIRTANATKPYGVPSVQGPRRKSEFQQPVSGLQQKGEHGDKNDPSGTWFFFTRANHTVSCTLSFTSHLHKWDRIPVRRVPSFANRKQHWRSLKVMNIVCVCICSRARYVSVHLITKAPFAQQTLWTVDRFSRSECFDFYREARTLDE